MKKMTALILVLICVLCLVACAGKDADNSKQQTDTNNNSTMESNTVSVPASTEDDAEYGCLQELVDSYGLPIYLFMHEGMNLTTIELAKDSAEWEWKSNDGIIVHENLEWCIADNYLIISGDWEEEFTINVDTWRAVSALDGKEYRIVIYDENGDVAFSAPF